MGFTLTTPCRPASRSNHAPDSTATQKTHTRYFSCRPENAYRRSRLKVRGQRFYSANLARWISRDPIDERGGLGLYLLVANDTVNGVDAIGRFGGPIYPISPPSSPGAGSPPPPGTLPSVPTVSRPPGLPTALNWRRTGQCVRPAWRLTGHVRFTGCSASRLSRLMVLPEEDTDPIVRNPNNNQWYNTDGIIPNEWPRNSWFKIPNNCRVEITCNGESWAAEACCNCVAGWINNWWNGRPSTPSSESGNHNLINGPASSFVTADAIYDSLASP